MYKRNCNQAKAGQYGIEKPLGPQKKHSCKPKAKHNEPEPTVDPNTYTMKKQLKYEDTR